MARPNSRPKPRPPREKAMVVVLRQHYRTNQIARMLGINRKLVWRWTTGRDISQEALDMVDDVREELARQCEEVANKMLGSLLRCDPDKANIRDKAIAAGVMIDKARLLRGEATQIVEKQSDHRSSLRQKLQALAHRSGFAQETEELQERVSQQA